MRNISALKHLPLCAIAFFLPLAFSPEPLPPRVISRTMAKPAPELERFGFTRAPSVPAASMRWELSALDEFAYADFFDLGNFVSLAEETVNDSATGLQALIDDRVSDAQEATRNAYSHFSLALEASGRQLRKATGYRS